MTGILLQFSSMRNFLWNLSTETGKRFCKKVAKSKGSIGIFYGKKQATIIPLWLFQNDDRQISDYLEFINGKVQILQK